MFEATDIYQGLNLDQSCWHSLYVDTRHSTIFYLGAKTSVVVCHRTHNAGMRRESLSVCKQKFTDTPTGSNYGATFAGSLKSMIVLNLINLSDNIKNFIVMNIIAEIW